MDFSNADFETVKDILLQLGIDFDYGTFYDFDENPTGNWIEIFNQDIEFH